MSLIPKTFLLILLIFFLGPLSAERAQATTDSEGKTTVPSKLIIGTKEAAPFSMKDGAGVWQGVSIELWKKLAVELQLEYEFREYDLQGLLTALQNKEIDAAVAALTITAEREVILDFSHPFHTSGLGIAVAANTKGHWFSIFDRLFSIDFLKIVGGLACLLLFIGTLVYFFEHRRNHEQFGGSLVEGVGSGFWWSAVTMTTVGYGDKSPKTLGGRIIGLLWMFTAIILISSFTAAITTSLTVSRMSSLINGPDDLHRTRIGCLNHSTSAEYLSREHIRFRPYQSVLDALKAIAAGEIDAVVYDMPILLYLANTEMKDKVTVLPITFEKQQYGIGLPAASPLREPLNQTMLKVTDSKEWQDLLFRYLGT